MSEASDVIYSFSKNRREEIRASLTTFKGFELGDLRVFVASENGEPIATPKGLSVRVDQLPDLLAAVEALVAATRTVRAA
jgi:hypothetical protein